MGEDINKLDEQKEEVTVLEEGKNEEEKTINKQKLIKGIKKMMDNSYLLTHDSEEVIIKVEEYYPIIEMLITNMYEKFYKDLTTNNQHPYSNKGDDKKEIILLFERIIKSLRYLLIDQNQVYKDIADPLELLAQLCDMNNVDDLLNKLIRKYVSYYNNHEEMCTISIKSYRKELQ